MPGTGYSTSPSHPASPLLGARDRAAARLPRPSGTCPLGALREARDMGRRGFGRGQSGRVGTQSGTSVSAHPRRPAGEVEEESGAQHNTYYLPGRVLRVSAFAWSSRKGARCRLAQPRGSAVVTARPASPWPPACSEGEGKARRCDVDFDRTATIRPARVRARALFCVCVRASRAAMGSLAGRMAGCMLTGGARGDTSIFRICIGIYIGRDIGSAPLAHPAMCLNATGRGQRERHGMTGEAPSASAVWAIQTIRWARRLVVRSLP